MSRTAVHATRGRRLGLPAPLGTSGSPTTGATASPRPVDTFTAARVPGSLIFVTRSGQEVRLGTDPGDFYCEHLFFVTQDEAKAVGSSVLRNADDAPLVSFLHVPRDAFTGQVGASYAQDERHAATREVVGRALRGFYELARPEAGPGPVRLLVTGYLAFQSVKDNPTGDFVSHRENLDAAMKEAFGPALLSSRGLVLSKADGRARYLYRVRDAESGRTRSVVLETRALPVDDRAIDGTSESSVQQAMRTFRPHAVLSMGVAPGKSYKAEFHADSGGLSLSPVPAHDASAPPARAHADNFALAEALELGGAAVGLAPA